MSTVIDVICLLAAVGLVALGVARLRGRIERRRYWVPVSGVVSSEEISGYGAAYEKVVAFHTREGRAVRGRPRNSALMTLSVIGRPVPVWYEPRDPNLFESRVHPLDRPEFLFFALAVLPAILLLVTLV